VAFKNSTLIMVFMEKKKLFTGKMNLELKKKIMKYLVWTTICSRDMDIDTDRQEKIRSL